ncbi:type II toxin-antitoxin system RelE/ParE family toxin [Algoriphagus sp.]|uniref:type II toxin-antitoxin system RelE/ParE family toxin n=1 Tax=Algoriphagus sp. TaxID=1872435 RepID=UPI002618E1E8|nr:type II toxin-antitoxin system RelE/ParE family toxin [Algoriphagus sp.]
MAKRIVIWTKTADLQFIGVLKYWVNRNKSTTYSKKLLDLVSKKTRQLSKRPFIYKSTEFNGVRVAPIGNFSIYYKVDGLQITIVAFWDNRQDPKELFSALKKSKESK